MTIDPVRSLKCGSKFTIRGTKWQKGQVIAYASNGNPMNDVVTVILDGKTSRFTRSAFLDEIFVLEDLNAN